ncbi:MAG: hypothetical protein Q4C70_05580 [Planctomycetia bacterium]|nr:hypothetical protein [Planctomycetia bacterium]
MRIFLAGIMQGSFIEMKLHSQEYRTRLKELLECCIPDAEVYDPFANHQNSVNYTDEVGKRVFLGHNYLCREMDVILAFVPEASMGTAIEMWEGNQNGAVVVTVTPLQTNWAVKFLSHRLYDSIDALEMDVRSGEFAQFVTETRKILTENRKNG